MDNSSEQAKSSPPIVFHGCICAVTGESNVPACIEVTQDRITRLDYEADPGCQAIALDLSGFLVMPGLVNAHDHLHYALHPQLGNPPYRNYIEWGEDIHKTLGGVITKYNAVSRDVRLWWGAIRNLLSGVTTVCHHDRLWPELQRGDFPIRVVQHNGWAHSPALGGDIAEAHAATSEDRAFILHAGEGTDVLAHQEISALDRLGILDSKTVLVHGLALDKRQIHRMKQCGTSLILCPSSNDYLFERIPDTDALLELGRVAIGNDSPLTATGDLLDEVRFAIQRCRVNARDAYRMVTDTAASVLRLSDGEGTLFKGGPADLIAVRDTGQPASTRVSELTFSDIEFVMVRGQVQLLSEDLRQRLPALLSSGLQPLAIGGHVRWLRAPVRSLLRTAEDVLGKGNVSMTDRPIQAIDENSILQVEDFLQQCVG